MRAPDIPKGQEQIMSAHFALAQAVQAVSQSLHYTHSPRHAASSMPSHYCDQPQVLDL